MQNLISFKQRLIIWNRRSLVQMNLDSSAILIQNFTIGGYVLLIKILIGILAIYISQLTSATFFPIISMASHLSA